MSSKDSFFSTDPPTTEFYTLSLHDALPIFARGVLESGPFEEGVQACAIAPFVGDEVTGIVPGRSEGHTSELQSPDHLVYRLLLEKNNAVSMLAGVNTLVVNPHPSGRTVAVE